MNKHLVIGFGMGILGALSSGAMPFSQSSSKIPEYVPSQKEIYVNEVRNEFVKEAEQEFDIHAYALGGSINPNVNEIAVDFYFDQQVDINDARWLLVTLQQKLTDKINKHEKIRPFLIEYPFPSIRANICLSFKENPSRKIKNVEFVHVGRGKVFYCKRPLPEEFEYEDLLIEPYEDTLKTYKLEDKPKIFKKLI